ncbi:hypothetical protein DL768_001590 [Monosporascus sp. mg162]|nr:hypothetical protein DL768_001590 [Monosporascus sp. mg162]
MAEVGGDLLGSLANGVIRHILSRWRQGICMAVIAIILSLWELVFYNWSRTPGLSSSPSRFVTRLLTSSILVQDERLKSEVLNWVAVKVLGRQQELFATCRAFANDQKESFVIVRSSSGSHYSWDQKLLVPIRPMDTIHLDENIKSEILSDSGRSQVSVLLEDIDAMGMKRGLLGAEKYRNGTSCTLSGLLNVLDGVVSQEGRIEIMAANEPEGLDEALIRRGRIDKEVYLGHISADGARQMFMRMTTPEITIEARYDLDEADIPMAEAADSDPTDARTAVDGKTRDKLSRELSSWIPANTLSSAQLQEYLLFYRGNPAEAANNISAWIQDETATMAQKTKMKGEERKTKPPGEGQSGEVKAHTAICRFSEPIAFNSILAYTYVMVQDLNGGDDTDASFYAGLLVSAYAVAEALTAMGWGALSDRYGRKPIVLMGLGGVAISSLIFGLATKYWVALLARFVGGALNGNVAVMQTMVAEMVKNPDHEPKAYASQPFVWTLGGIIGSAMGGFLAQPAQFYPSLFPADGIFGRYPYLLPNLVSVVVIVLAIIQGIFFLEETNPREKKTIEEHAVEDDVADERTPLRKPRRSRSALSHQSERPRFMEESLPVPVEQNFDLHGILHTFAYSSAG